MAVARAAKDRRHRCSFFPRKPTPRCRCEPRRWAVPVWYHCMRPPSGKACQKSLRVWRARLPGDRAHRGNTTGRTAETYLRTRPKDMKQWRGVPRRRSGNRLRKGTRMYDGIDMTGVAGRTLHDWAYVDRWRKMKGKSSSKESIRAEDARLCVEHGLDGILVSNHGGRSTETLRPTIQALPKWWLKWAAAFRCCGRRFSARDDVFKLWLWGHGGGIGRPYLWGMGAFGQAAWTA